jgi:PAS domain S-box-containing protein
MDKEKTFDNHPDLVIIFEQEKVLYLNPVALELFELPVGYERLCPLSLLFQLKPDQWSDSEEWNRMLWECRQNGHFRKNFLIELKGSACPSEWLLTLDRSVNPLQYILYIRNDHSQEFFSSLVTHAPDVIMKFDRNYRYIYINEKAEAYSGIPARCYIGRKVDDPAIGADPNTQKIWRHTLKEVYSSAKSKQVEFRFPSGNWQDWILNPQVNEQGQVQSVTAVSRDISRRKILEERLRMVKENFRSLAEASPDVIMEFDLKLRHIYCSENVHLYTHLTAEDFIGKTHAEMNFPEHLKHLWKESLRWVLKYQESKRIIFQLPSGKYVDWYLSPRFDLKTGRLKSIYSFGRDITELKATEEKLQLRQKQLTFALNISRLAYWEIKLDSREFRFDARLAELYGIPFNGSQFQYLSINEFGKRYVLAEDRVKFFNYFHNLFTGKDGEQKELEFRLEKKNSIHHFLINAYLIKNEDHQNVTCFGTSQDITLIKQKEEELRLYRTQLEALINERTAALQSSEARLAEAMRLAKLGILDYNFHTQLFEASQAVFNMLGLNPNLPHAPYFSPQQVLQAVHPLDMEKLQTLFKKIKENRNQNRAEHIEFRLIGHDHKVRNIYASINFHLQANKDQEKLQGLIQDITELRKTEAEKEKLNAIIETSPDIVAIFSPDDRLLYLNEAGKKFFKISPFLMYRESRTCANGKLRNELLNSTALQHALEHGLWKGENTLVNHDQKKVPVSQLILAYRDHEGTLVCYATFVRDISEQKQIEQDLTFKQHELDTFVYRAYHDLKGPIATLQGLHQVVEIDIKDEQALKYFNLYQQETNRLHQTLSSLIEVVRIKDLPLHLEDVDLNELVQESLKQINQYPGAAQLNIEQEIRLSQSFRSDRKLLVTLLHHLLKNAIDFQRKRADSYVRISIKENKKEHQLILGVSDNGEGIPKTILPKVFNMFYRGSELSRGAGLGLYMVKNIVERLQGKIEIKSEEGKGTCVMIKLPVLMIG